MPGVNVPETRYAKTIDGVHIAYQVLGDGPSDLVFVPGFVFNVEHLWEGWPQAAARKRESDAGNRGWPRGSRRSTQERRPRRTASQTSK